VILGARTPKKLQQMRSCTLWIDGDGWVQHPVDSAATVHLVRVGFWKTQISQVMSMGGSHWQAYQIMEIFDGLGFELQVELKVRLA
jgi:hypothetical protein